MTNANHGTIVPPWLSRVLPALMILYVLALIALAFFGIHINPPLVISVDARRG